MSPRPPRRTWISLRVRIALTVWVFTALALGIAGVLAVASAWQATQMARDSGFVDMSYVTTLMRQMVTLVVAGSTLTALGSWLVAGWIARPISVAGDVATRFGAGDLAIRIPVRGNDEVAVLGRQFNQMADDVNQMIDAQGHFISDTAHELRTPTAALVATASALDNPVTRDEAAIMVAPQLRRLSSLTEDLLALARFDSSREQLRTQRVDLGGLSAASVRSVGQPGQVRVFSLGSQPIEVECDAVRVQTIVRNLVANGLKHGAPPVTVLVQAVGKGATITVVDEGPGVPLERAERLFDRFVRGDDARHGTGSGLGLAIARENARLHGGELVVDEGGHAFRLSLPGIPSTPQKRIVVTEPEHSVADWRAAVVSRFFWAGLGISLFFLARAIAPSVFELPMIIVAGGPLAPTWAPWLPEVLEALALMVGASLVLYAAERMTRLRSVPVVVGLVLGALMVRAALQSPPLWGWASPVMVAFLVVFTTLPCLFDPRLRR